MTGPDFQADIALAMRAARSSGTTDVEIGLWLASAVNDGADEPEPGSLADAIYNWWTIHAAHDELSRQGYA